MQNFYVLEVNREREEEILDIFKSDIFNESICRCFILKRNQARKFGLEWKICVVDILKGIIFFEIKDIDLFKDRLKKCKRFFELNNHRCVKLKRLNENDISFIKKFENDSMTIAHSIGDIYKDDIIIKEGPLKGLENMIRKVDRHKRLAFLKYKFSFSDYDICLGLEIKNKIINKIN